MNVEQARALLLKLPYVAETMQWGDNLVFRVGSKELGGKMFALMNLSADAHGVVSFAAGPERFAELVEVEGFRPAPYLARAHWVAAERWDVVRSREWTELFANAHAIVHAKLPKRTRDLIALPAAQQKKLLAAKKAAAKVSSRTLKSTAKKQTPRIS